MQITIDLPEHLSSQLEAHIDLLSRRALETIALEAYRAKLLAVAEFRQMLGFESWRQTYDFLEGHGLHDPEEDPKELILENLARSLEDTQAGRTKPISELWDSIES